jgi:hypothetical protein
VMPPSFGDQPIILSDRVLNASICFDFWHADDIFMHQS